MRSAALSVISVLCLAALAPSAALTPGKVIVVGSHNQDLITSGARIPRPGETVLHDTFSQAFGGKGANQAVQAALLGAETHFVGKVGDDAYGAAALQNLRDRGVIIDNVQTTKTAPTGVAFVAVGAEDETNSIVVVPGANFELTPDDVDAKSSTARECSSASSKYHCLSDDAAGAGARGGSGPRLRPQHGARAAGRRRRRLASGGEHRVPERGRAGTAGRCERKGHSGHGGWRCLCGQRSAAARGEVRARDARRQRVAARRGRPYPRARVEQA